MDTAQFPTGANSRFYLQDATGGIHVFGSPQSCAAVGDYVQVTGTIAGFNGLTEITTPGLSVTPLGGFTLFDPLALTPSAASASFQGDRCEPNESRLVKVGPGFVRTAAGAMPAAGATFAANTDLRLIHAGPDSATNYCALRIVSASSGCGLTNSLVGQTINRAPLAPIGWPSAVAPPWTLIFSCGMPRSRMANMATQAKASLTSNRSTSSTVQPAFFYRDFDECTYSCICGASTITFVHRPKRAD